MWELGTNAKDMVTGFSGVIVGRAEYLGGGRRLAIQPTTLDAKGKPVEAEWFEAERIVPDDKKTLFDDLPKAKPAEPGKALEVDPQKVSENKEAKPKAPKKRRATVRD